MQSPTSSPQLHQYKPHFVRVCYVIRRFIGMALRPKLWLNMPSDSNCKNLSSMLERSSLSMFYVRIKCSSKIICSIKSHFVCQLAQKREALFTTMAYKIPRALPQLVGCAFSPGGEVFGSTFKGICFYIEYVCCFQTKTKETLQSS